MSHLPTSVPSRLRSTSRFALAGIALCAATLGCAPHGPSEPGAPAPPDSAQGAAGNPSSQASDSPSRGTPSPGKPSAPVTVSTEIQDRRALVTIVAASEGRDIEATVRGLDGVTVVTPTAPARAASLAAGGKLVIDASFTATTPDGTLVVEVRGTFGGRELASVRTISLGRPPGAAPKDPPRTDTSGRPIVVVPGN